MQMNRKLRSQADAPVELVVAIIILVASLSIASMVMASVGEEQCKSQLRGELQQLQLKMQDLALQSPPSTRTVDFILPGCSRLKTDLLRFVYYSRSDFCRACPGHYSGCWKVQLASYIPDKNNPDEGSYYVPQNEEICVDMAGDMQLVLDAGPECEQLSENPCAIGEECNADRSLVPSNVFDSTNPNTPSRWRTLQTKGRKFEITLAKTIVPCTSGAQCPAISICAIDSEKNNP